MSVVKKYDKGGKTPKVYDVEDFLAKKINEGRFTAKALPYVRQAATNLSKLAKSGEWDDVYSYDPINSQYSIDVGKMSDETKLGPNGEHLT